MNEKIFENYINRLPKYTVNISFKQKLKFDQTNFKICLFLKEWIHKTDFLLNW